MRADQKRARQTCLWLMVAALGLSLIDGCGVPQCVIDIIRGDAQPCGAPSQGQSGPDVPLVIPSVDQCLCMTKLTTRVGGRASAPGKVAWAALFANGVILRSSAGVPVPEGVFSDVSLTVDVPNGSVNPGTYDFIVVLGSDQNSVGNLAAHAAISNLQRVTIAHIACTPSPGCATVLYGDTLKLKANMVGSNLVITSRGPGEFSDAGVQWASVNAATGGDTTFLVNLGYGDFYPLKPNDGQFLQWRARASDPATGKTTEVGVSVDANVTLGTDNTAYDTQIIAAAIEYGIPPTISKAQIYVEDRSFNPNAFRYEPNSFDYRYVSMGAWRGALGTVLDEDPYFHWNIGIPSHNPPWPPLSSGSLAQGDWLVAPDDIDFRNKYTRVDDDGDGAYSAWELVDHNTTQKWTRPPVNFIAQTTIASSYGLKQISWLAALYPLGWNDANGGRPTELCDPQLNISMGTHYLRYIYDNWTSPSQPWIERWRSALVQYNRGYGVDPSASQYDDDVYSNLRLCIPLER